MMKYKEQKKLLTYLVFKNKNGEDLTQLYLKSDVILLADVFKKTINTFSEEDGINPLYCVSLASYTWQCGMKYYNIKIQTTSRWRYDFVVREQFYRWNLIRFGR